MTQIEQMIQDMCPNGVEFRTLGEVCKTSMGEFVKKDKQNPNAPYPVYNGGSTNTGFYDDYNTGANKVIISARGAAGFVNKVEVPFWAGNSCHVIDVTDNKLNWRFLYYYLKNHEYELIANQQKGGGVPAVSKKQVEAVEIPLPPIEIQKKIVECLDKFSALAAELQAELQLRRKQYEYYRTQLLTPHSDCNSADNTDDAQWEWKTLGKIAKYRRGSFPQPYGRSEWYDGEGAMPFVQVADVEEIGMCLKQETKQRISKLAMPKSVFVPKGTVIVTLQGSIGKVAVTQYDSYVDRTLGIFESYQTDINKKYFAYQLERVFSIKREKARGGTIKTITKEEFTDFSIPIPSIAEQARIVSILDKFEALTTSLSDGIPAEQIRQQKRYEHFRDLLLTFDRKAE